MQGVQVKRTVNAGPTYHGGKGKLTGSQDDATSGNVKKNSGTLVNG